MIKGKEPSFLFEAWGVPDDEDEKRLFMAKKMLDAAVAAEKHGPPNPEDEKWYLTWKLSVPILAQDVTNLVREKRELQALLKRGQS